MAIKIDDIDHIRRQHGTMYCDYLLVELAKLLMGTLRNIDIPARWSTDVLLVMLPSLTQDEARLVAERLSGLVRQQLHPTGSHSISVGISQVQDTLEATITLAESNLDTASQGNGDSIVNGDPLISGKESTRNLSSYFQNS